MTSTPVSGTNDKPFHLFAHLKGDDGVVQHKVGFWFWTGTPGCEVGLENSGVTNLVISIERAG
jgi:hypothetical protein